MIPAMALDDDTAVSILLDYALRDLDEACRKLAKPQLGWWEFVCLVGAVLVVRRPDASEYEQICLSAARRVRQEILLSL